MGKYILRLDDAAERMDIVKDVAIYKIANKLPVLDSSRENAMLEKNINKIKNEEYKKYYEKVLKGFLEARYPP